MVRLCMKLCNALQVLKRHLFFFRTLHGDECCSRRKRWWDNTLPRSAFPMVLFRLEHNRHEGAVLFLLSYLSHLVTFELFSGRKISPEVLLHDQLSKIQIIPCCPELPQIFLTDHRSLLHISSSYRNVHSARAMKK